MKEGVGRCTADGTTGRRDDVDEMVSNKCIHKKINHHLLTLLLLHIVVEDTTKMCVQILRQIANDRGWFQHRNGAMMGEGQASCEGGESGGERERCVSDDQRFYLNNQTDVFYLICC